MAQMKLPKWESNNNAKNKAQNKQEHLKITKLEEIPINFKYFGFTLITTTTRGINNIRKALAACPDIKAIIGVAKAGRKYWVIFENTGATEMEQQMAYNKTKTNVEYLFIYLRICATY